MPAYLIGRVNITDRERYAEYIKATPPIIAQYGGRFIVRGGEVATLEGPEETARVVVIEFPTFEAVQAFFHSEAYGAAKLLREGAATGQFLAVDGYTPA